jgi:activator of 2-hydroxyglutaryl-CoA dehydratase
MAGRRVDEPVFFTGGVALVSGMVEALQAVLQCPVRAVKTPLLTGALGAAILAAG